MFFSYKQIQFIFSSQKIEACSHGRSHQFFAASIFKENVFTGYPCSTYEAYRAGTCKKENGVQMGDPVPKTASGVYYLQTSNSSPYAQGRKWIRYFSLDQ